MKSIMISIQPQWVEKILNGEKTIEIRKTMPKCELPVKVYIYCTQGQMLHDMKDEEYWTGKRFAYGSNKSNDIIWSATPFVNGKVVAEFTLNKVDRCGEAVYDANRDLWEDWNTLGLNNSCVHPYDLEEYSNGYELYAWHIDNLKIYDKPKELSEFKKENKCYYSDYDKGCCCECCTFYDLGDCDGRCSKLERPPQSWCYCEGEM